MNPGMKLINLSVKYPKTTIGITSLITVLIILIVAISNLTNLLPFIPKIKIDTDPENMLRKDEPVRVFHNEMQKQFTIYEIVVLGVVNEKHPQGVFNAETLNKIYQLTEFAKTLQWENPQNPDSYDGVIPPEIIAPSTVDNVEQGGIGEVRFEWLMPTPPKTDEEALVIKKKAEKLPFLRNTLISEDGKAIAIYIPITAKNQSYRVSKSLEKKIEEIKGEEKFYITGLPVANDTFGVEMFKQMSISSPLAMIVIFLLMWFFFRKIILILSPLIVAVITTVWTMGLLVLSGNTVHIMSSMIPVFIMPISVLDSIHILSEFFERYSKNKPRNEIIMDVMNTLFYPMLYTSLTTLAGFASLALTPNPPVQVFGIFIAIGVAIAWILTMTFIPAYAMLLSEKKLENFGASVKKTSHEEEEKSILAKSLYALGRFTYNRYKLILLGTAILVITAIYGITLIEVNDNPTRWFKSTHKIRIADAVLNKHFGGTYMAYLALRSDESQFSFENYEKDFKKRLKNWFEKNGVEEQKSREIVEKTHNELLNIYNTHRPNELNSTLEALQNWCEEQLNNSDTQSQEVWELTERFVGLELQRDEIFKQPEMLQYIEQINSAMEKTGIVGKTNSLPTLVKTVHRELMGGDEKEYRIPDTSRAVAQCIITYEGSHRPQDIYHFVTPDYKSASIWVQLKSGDNKDMTKVVEAVDKFIKSNPPPFPLKYDWYGLTYINVVWQKKMVIGMLEAFLGSFLVVLAMMIILFRSGLWGLLSMIPLTITIGAIYGAIGLIGKYYDMPVAVLSSLTLGLAVDYAIHFLARGRVAYNETGSWEKAHTILFGETARALYRNIIVIALGFTPLLLAPLVPYITVGTFMASIMLFSGIGTLIILPALARLFEPLLFPKNRLCSITCMCNTCIVTGITIVAAVALNLYQFLNIGWTKLTWVSLTAILILSVVCFISSRRNQCKPCIEDNKQQNTNLK
ncbi:MAG: MMPL family transporter [Candidatus Hydrogenedentes bacterium]|nr:MMPL family transporter [Candidatus Hydrogenedentota bacterium]